jgi:hypothetical protein
MKIIRITKRKEEADAFNRELSENKDKEKCFILHFFMKGCIHCENLEPKMKNIEKRMLNEAKYNNVTLGKIDAEMMNDVNVDNAYEFPTLKVIKNGETHQYKGSPEENAILTWINSLVKNKNTNKNKNIATKGVHLSNHNSLGRRSLQSNSNRGNASGVTNKNNKNRKKTRKNKNRKTTRRENNSNKRNKRYTRKNKKNKRSKKKNN